MAYFIVDVRWENRDDEFHEIAESPIVGNLDDAKRAAENYLTRHNLIRYMQQWLQGDADINGPVYYGNLPNATIRIRQ